MKIVLGLAVTLLFMGCALEKSEETQKTQAEVSYSIEQIAKVLKEESKKISTKVLTETKKVAQKKPTKMIEEKVSIDGKLLFAKCSSCHGVNGDKKALNKSQSIKGWSVVRLSDAINGYKDGSYGGSMKGVMRPQVNKLSSDEIKALSEYISKL